MRTYFDHENLEVYPLELCFVGWVATLLAKIKQRPSEVRIAEVSDQLDRASVSALLNTPKEMDDGNGKRAPNFSMTDAVRLRNAQLAWMRWSPKRGVRKTRYKKARKCCSVLLRCSRMHGLRHV